MNNIATVTAPARRRGAAMADQISAPAYGSFLDRAVRAGVDIPVQQRRGRLTVDLDAYGVSLDGETVTLSARQVELLSVFLAAPGRVWSRGALGTLCWGKADNSRRVDVQLCRIRNRLGVDLFRNTRSRGWSLKEESLVGA